MMRTEAPNDLEGRGLVNFARTTPELPVKGRVSRGSSTRNGANVSTMWSRNLAPDHPDLAASNLLLSPVDICYLLAKVEAAPVSSYALYVSGNPQNVLGGIRIVDAFDLDQARPGVGGPSATLVAEVATPGGCSVRTEITPAPDGMRDVLRDPARVFPSHPRPSPSMTPA